MVDRDVILLGAAVSGAASVVFGWRAWRFLARAVHTSGRITHFTEREYKQQTHDGSDTRVEYLPHVEFLLQDGSPVSFRSDVGHASQAKHGLTVAVTYDAASPAGSAEIAGFPAMLRVWSSVVIAGVMTAALLLLYFDAP